MYQSVVLLASSIYSPIPPGTQAVIRERSSHRITNPSTEPLDMKIFSFVADEMIERRRRLGQSKQLVFEGHWGLEGQRTRRWPGPRSGQSWILDFLGLRKNGAGVLTSWKFRRKMKIETGRRRRQQQQGRRRRCAVEEAAEVLFPEQQVNRI